MRKLCLVFLFIAYLCFGATTVARNTYSVVSGLNNQRTIVRDSRGNLYVAYSAYDGANYQIKIAFSSDGGDTWDESWAVLTDFPFYSIMPTISIDSHDKLHIVWRGGENLMYCEYPSSVPEIICTGTTYPGAFCPSCAVDERDNVHVVFTGCPSSWLVRYMVKNATTSVWSAVEEVGMLTPSRWCSVEIDNLSNPHIVYRNTYDSHYRIAHQYKTHSGTWQGFNGHTFDTLDYVSGDYSSVEYTSIYFDTAGNLYTLWTWMSSFMSYPDTVRFRKFDARDSIWLPQVNIYSHEDSLLSYSGDVAIDARGDVFVLYHNNYNVYLKKSTDGGMTFFPETVLTHITKSVYPNIRGSNFPSFNRVDTSCIEYVYTYAGDTSSTTGYSLMFDKLCRRAPREVPPLIVDSDCLFAARCSFRESAGTIAFGICSPDSFQLFDIGSGACDGDTHILGNYYAGTELVFYLNLVHWVPYHFRSDELIPGSDSLRCRIDTLGTNHWMLYWELSPTAGDWDYNDLEVEIFCISRETDLCAHFIDPAENIITSCADQQISLSIACCETLGDTTIVFSNSVTTEFFDSVSMSWMHAVHSPDSMMWLGYWTSDELEGHAHWLWTNRHPAVSYHGEWFRVIVESNCTSVDSGYIKLQCDNKGTVYCNGEYVDTTSRGTSIGTGWGRMCTFDLTTFLHGGSDTIMILAYNDASIAGLIFEVGIMCASTCCGKIDSSTIMLSINGEMHDIYEEALSLLDDTLLLFSPVAPDTFINGDTVFACLVAASDTCGGSLRDSSICRTFFVDLQPPILTAINPTPFSTIDTFETRIEFALFDSISGVDESEISVTVQDSLCSFTFEHTDSGTFVHLDSFFTFNLIDTVEICVLAHDSPNVCMPNTLDTCIIFYVSACPSPIMTINSCPESEHFILGDTITLTWSMHELLNMSLPCSVEVILCDETLVYSAFDSVFSWEIPQDASVCDSVIFVVSAYDSFCAWGYDTCICNIMNNNIIATVVSPLPQQITACDPESIIIAISSRYEIDSASVVLNVNGQAYTVFDEQLSWISPNLIFKPQPEWTATDTVSASLIFANDIYGNMCENLPLNWLFFTDRLSPHSSLIDPSEEYTRNPSQPVVIEVHDAVSPIDTQNLILAINGIDYSINDIIWTPSDANLSGTIRWIPPFDLPPFANGETVYVIYVLKTTLMSATRMFTSHTIIL